jgi:hypothetical protein
MRLRTASEDRVRCACFAGGGIRPSNKWSFGDKHLRRELSDGQSVERPHLAVSVARGRDIEFGRFRRLRAAGAVSLRVVASSASCRTERVRASRDGSSGRGRIAVERPRRTLPSLPRRRRSVHRTPNTVDQYSVRRMFPAARAAEAPRTQAWRGFAPAARCPLGGRSLNVQRDTSPRYGQEPRRRAIRLRRTGRPRIAARWAGAHRRWPITGLAARLIKLNAAVCQRRSQVRCGSALVPFNVQWLRR